MRPSFIIAQDGAAITCLLCRRTSHHPGDVVVHFCGACNWFHDATPYAVKEFRYARNFAFMNAVSAHLNLAAACSLWLGEPGWPQWMGLLSFMVGGFGARLAWRLTKRWWILKPFGQFT